MLAPGDGLRRTLDQRRIDAAAAVVLPVLTVLMIALVGAFVAIERRAFTTPWSLAMFVLELSKPSGVCLAAEIENELLAYGGRLGENAVVAGPPVRLRPRVVSFSSLVASQDGHITPPAPVLRSSLRKRPSAVK